MGNEIKTFFYAALIALTIRCFAFEPFSIPSASMVPTLLVGDLLFVSKYTYGYSSKSAFFGMAPFKGRIGGHAPERGDVVVFKLPSNPSVDYIKRIVGMPGDQVQVKNGRVFINGTMLERTENKVVAGNKNGMPVSVIEYTETLPGGRQHIIFEEGDDKQLDNTGLYDVPEGHYFMMGDNRDNSLDSRVQQLVGYVPQENLVGPARVLFFSIEEGTRFFELWKWATDVRFSRLLKTIQ